MAKPKYFEPPTTPPPVNSPIVKAAAKYLGVTSGPEQRRLFSSGQARAWCADFVTTIARQQGADVPSTAAVEALYQDAKKRGRLSSTPTPGSFVIYQKPGSTKFDHTGIVENYDPKTGMVTTIEGNTGNPKGGPTGVFRKSFNVNNPAKTRGFNVLGYYDTSKAGAMPGPLPVPFGPNFTPSPLPAPATLNLQPNQAILDIGNRVAAGGEFTKADYEALMAPETQNAAAVADFNSKVTSNTKSVAKSAAQGAKEAASYNPDPFNVGFDFEALRENFTKSVDAGEQRLLAQKPQPYTPPPAEPKPPGLLEQIGSGISGAAQWLGEQGAAFDAMSPQEKIGNAAASALGPLGNLLAAPTSPQAASTAGTVEGLYGLAKGATELGLAAGPVGLLNGMLPEWQKTEAQTRFPVADFVGQQAPYLFVGPELKVGQGIKPLLQSAGANAAFDAGTAFLQSPNDPTNPIGSRFQNAAIQGGISGLANTGLGVFLPRVFPSLRGGPDVVDVQPVRTPGQIEETQALLDAQRGFSMPEAAPIVPREGVMLGQQQAPQPILRPDGFTVNQFNDPEAFNRVFQAPPRSTFERVDLTDPQGRVIASPGKGVPTSADIAMGRLTPPAPLDAPKLLGADGLPGRFEAPRIDTPGIIRPDVPTPGRVDALSIPKAPEPPAMRVIDGGKAVQTDGPQGMKLQYTPEGNVTARGPQGQEFYAPKGFEQRAIAEAIQRVQKDAQAPEGFANTLESALSLIKAKQKYGILSPEEAAKQMDMVNLLTQAGRSGKGLTATRREIQEGLGTISKELGKAEVKAREDLAPFTLHLKSIKPSTFVENIGKELNLKGAKDPGWQQAVERLQQMAGKYGLTPTTTGKGGRSTTSLKQNAIAIAEQIKEHPAGRYEMTDVYFDLYNFKSGAKDGFVRSYPVRTFESANVSPNSVAIPADAPYASIIAKEYDDLRTLATAPDLPDTIRKPLSKLLNKPGVTAKDMKDFRKSLNDLESLKRFCELFGLK